MKKKIIGIFVCMLLIATALPVLGTTDEQCTNGDIDIQIKGGLGATVNITNNGNETLTNLSWSFSISKSLFGMAILISGTNETGTIPSLAPGASEQLKLMPVGFGIIKLKIVLIDIPDCLAYNDMMQLFIVLIDIPDIIPE